MSRECSHNQFVILWGEKKRERERERERKKREREIERKREREREREREEGVVGRESKRDNEVG